MKRIIKAFFGFIVAAISLISCNESMSEHLAAIDTLVYEAPDSALTALRSIQPSRLRTRGQRAKYALLKSITFDKSLIDVKSDSIIAPAVKYYGKHGSPDDRMRAYYYRGLVSFYSDDFEEAMEYFSKASLYAPEALNKSAVGLLYDKMARIYNSLFDFESSLRNAQMAATAYLEAGDSSYYMDELLTVLNTEIVLEKYDSASILARNIWKNEDGIDSLQLSSLYSNTLKISTYTKDPETDSIISDYLSAFLRNESLVDWLTVADVYCKSKDYEKAYRIIADKHEYITLSEDNKAYPILSATYHLLSSEIFEHLGDYKKALEAYSEYVRITDEYDLRVFESKAKFAEELFRQAMERQELKFRNIILSLISIAVLVIFAIVSAVVAHKLETKKKENEHLTRLCAEAREEIKELQAWKNSAMPDKDTLQLLEHRLQLLNECIVEYMSGCDANVRAKLETVLNDRNAFLESTQAYFMLSHPEFLTMLKDKGLDRKEIGICCLIASGAKGKNIADRLCIKEGSYRNFVSRTRRKLDLGKDSRELATYLADMIGKTR